MFFVYFFKSIFRKLKFVFFLQFLKSLTLCLGAVRILEGFLSLASRMTV